MSHTSTLRVAMIGHGFMGAAHSQGWRVAPRFFDLPAVPELTLLVGRNAAGAVAAAGEGAKARGVFAMVGFTYRRVPAVAFARDMVAAGRIGAVRQVRAAY